MKTTKVIALVAASLLLAAINLGAATTNWSVNFQGRTDASGNPPTPPLSFGTDNAGVVPSTLWNNVDDQYGFTVPNDDTTGGLTDSTGNFSPVTIAFAGDDSWFNDVQPATITTANAKMMNGILKHSTSGDGTLRLTFNNVPEGQYDLYIYLSMNGDDVAVNVSDSDFLTTYYVREMHQFRDTNTFVQGLNTSPTGTRDLCNYVKLGNLGTYGRGRIGTQVKWIANSDGCGVPGLQLVNIGPAQANTNPVSITAQPFSRRVLVGQTNITLSVSTRGLVSSYQWFSNSVAITDATNASHLVAPITSANNADRYYVVVTNNINRVQSINAVMTVGSLVAIRGAHEQLWYGHNRVDVENGSLDNLAPSLDYGIGVFSTPFEQGSNYGDRLSALFQAPVSGKYVFWINADDDADLFLSTDATPANKRMIAQEMDWANPSEWTVNSGGTAARQLQQKRSDQWSPDGGVTVPFATGIDLVGGSNYYLEAAHHEGGGGDFVEANYKIVGQADPGNGSATKINAFVMAPYAMSLDAAYIVVTNPPQNTAAFQSGTATFNIVAGSAYVGDTSSAAPAIAYQWQTAPAGSSTYSNIPGANGTSFTTPLLTLADDGRTYRVTMIAGDAATNSAAATLSLIRDTTAPRPVQITSVLGNLRTVTLTFNEMMDKASTEIPGNYVFTPGNIVATNATLDSAGTTLTITTGTQLTPNVTNVLTITGAKDLAGNTVALNTTISFKFVQVTYEANILFDGPIGYYRFEDAVGNPVAVNSGSTGGSGAYYTGNEPSAGAGGTPSGAHGEAGPRPPAFVGFAANNNAATFDGIGEWVDTKNQFLQNRAAFTLEYWVRPTNRVTDPTTFGTRIGLVGQNDAIEYGFIDANTIQIWTPNGGSLNTTYTFPDNEWHHVATIADGTNLKNYFDGVFINQSGNATANYGNSIYNVHIGGAGVFDATGNFFTGQMDEVAIFDKAIPAARVAQHFSAGKTGGVITTSGTTTPPLTIQMNIARSGNNLLIYWAPGGGTLQSKPALDGLPTTWTNVGTANPAIVPIGAGAQFFRVLQVVP